MTILRRGPGTAWRMFRHAVTGARAPIFLSYAMTFRCTNRCAYCDLPPSGEELTIEELRPLLDGFRSMGLVRLGLTGGEPLLHPDVGPLIRHCRDIGVLTVMSTNGALVRDRIDALEGLDVASVSVDGGRALQDDLRGSGSFDTAVDAIALLRARGVGVVLSAVLTARNIDHIDEILEVAEDAGVATVWQPYFEPGHSPTDGDPDRPDPAGFQEAISRLIAVKRRRPQRIASSLPYLRFISGHYPDYDTTDCLAGELFFGLSPDGQLHPCYPLIGREPGIPITPENLREVVEQFPSVHCEAPCYCNGHIENKFLLRLHPRAVFDAFSSLRRFKGG